MAALILDRTIRSLMARGDSLANGSDVVVEECSLKLLWDMVCLDVFRTTNKGINSIVPTVFISFEWHEWYDSDMFPSGSRSRGFSQEELGNNAKCSSSELDLMPASLRCSCGLVADDARLVEVEPLRDV